jgi:23S rRNA (uracil1939-C5)-methyltransferase
VTAEAPRELELAIDSLAAGGDAVGRGEDGRVVFVPGAAPGERVRVRLIEEHRQFARGALVEVVAASPDRVEPPCPLFRERTCGGCVWQHVAYPVQAAAKQALVASALRRSIADGMALEPIETPVAPYRWRRRARLHWVRTAGSEAALVGLYAPRSHRVTQVPACPQLEPALEAALPAIHRALAPGLFQKGEIDLLCDPGGQVQVAVRGPCRARSAEALVGQGGVVGVILGRQVFGGAALEIEPGQWAQADRFAQPSRAGNAALIAAVDRATHPRDGARILELYAGSGNLTRTLLDGAASVLAVDTRPGRQIGHPHLRWQVGPVEDVVADLIGRGAGGSAGSERAEFDLVVLDPPREGARAALDAIAALGAPRMVYVSCDPATLARDLDVLAGLGYRALSAAAIDLMPQTAHVEVVVSLTARRA